MGSFVTVRTNFIVAIFLVKEFFHSSFYGLESCNSFIARDPVVFYDINMC